jgi:glycosyl transferase family 25
MNTQDSLNIDKAFCLSLESAKDRQQLLPQEFIKINQKVAWSFGEKSSNPQKAVSQQHQDLCRQAHQQNLDRILIFEDDVRFYAFDPKQIKQLNKFMAQNQTWDIIYLGGILGRLWKTKHKGMARIRCAGVQSYIVSSRAYQKILDIDYDQTTKAVDTIYKKILKAYAPYPLMTRQEDDCILASSIQGTRNQITGTNALSGSQEKMWRGNRKKEIKQVYFNNLHKWLLRIDQ